MKLLKILVTNLEQYTGIPTFVFSRTARYEHDDLVNVLIKQIRHIESEDQKRNFLELPFGHLNIHNSPDFDWECVDFWEITPDVLDNFRESMFIGNMYSRYSPTYKDLHKDYQKFLSQIEYKRMQQERIEQGRRHEQLARNAGAFIGAVAEQMIKHRMNNPTSRECVIM
jgi:hypothetical protein